jgi:hypothetical protein
VRPSENDLTRARRQQQIVAAMKDKVTSFETFVRLPWVSWAAPEGDPLRHGGPTLLGVAAPTLTGGSGDASSCSSLRRASRCRRRRRPDRVRSEKQRAVRRFLRG